MLKKIKVRRGCTVPSQLNWPSIKNLDGTEELTGTGSADGCSVPLKKQLVGTRLSMDTKLVLSVGGSLPPVGAGVERAEFDIKHLIYL